MASLHRFSFQLQRCQYSSHPAPTSSTNKRPKVTVHALRRLFKGNVPIAMMTAHDYPSAMFVENSGMEMCLVGDSLGMVALGYDSTTQVTMQDMIHHCKAVSRGAKSPFLVGDMPFGSFEASQQSAVENAVRIIKEGGMEAVKIEGGLEMCSTIKKITDVGIPVMGHIGLTPQRQANLGGYRVQGKTAEKAALLLEDALSLQSAGCFALVLEAIPAPVSTYITQKLNVPTIGIGAGLGCSGQVLVQQDMLGCFDRFVPRFCKQYENLTERINNAMKEYRDEVKCRKYPAEQHCYPMAEGEEEKFQQMVKKWETKG